ncbi:predicted protein [Paecilomyces variotii No. 5]|uniref:ferric-chelate reductase (NADPH) n=1 Tax=Byssochlamys spectabilis (strain No. 5 / NBRC 109023) TaxID=1356009 RepID=V5GD45_BYSSN|nr:predicted protein [Paecilomyces variotii No. 5]
MTQSRNSDRINGEKICEKISSQNYIRNWVRSYEADTVRIGVDENMALTLAAPGVFSNLSSVDRMSMSMGDMPMGDMSMGDGVPGLFYLQKMYWAVVGSAVAAATVVHVLNCLLARQRLRDTSLTPSKPKSLFFGIYATITAITREVAYATLRPLSIGPQSFHLPPLGPVLIVLSNLIVVLVFCFYKLDSTDRWNWENVGYRTGFITLAQVPLIFLLAGRQNIIGFLTGLSYERLNWFHRWIARTLWLSATIHMGFWFRDWAQYDYIQYQLQNDPITKRGFAAWCILTFIVISSAGPVRRLSYEIFVLQHIVTFAGFLAAVWLHVPNEVKAWVWISIGLVVFDRVVRYALVLYNNVSVFHRSTGHLQNGLFAHQASFAPLPGNVTRVIVENPTFRWKPGQHVFLACHSIAPFQNHPFTIASLPSDRRLEFLVRAEKGGTGRIFQYASKNHNVQNNAAVSGTKTVFLEGPYGAMRPLRQFDSVVLMAGGMGATLVVPLLRDIVEDWKNECAVQTTASSLRFLKVSRFAATKRIRLVWVIRSRSQLSWFEPQLRSVLADLETCKRAQSDFDRTIELTVYVTCDEKLNNKPAYSKLPSYSDPIQQTPAISAFGGEKLEDKVVEKEGVSIHTAPVSASQRRSPHDNNPGYLPGGGCCCCDMAIEEEDGISIPRCTCSGPAPPEKLPSSSRSSREERIPHYPITLLSGRPNPQSIIRKVLEQAEGESAVVVCGPPGLADDVRRSVVSLSDERAVHKGTGAQGIYLHVEAFGW